MLSRAREMAKERAGGVESSGASEQKPLDVIEVLLLKSSVFEIFHPQKDPSIELMKKKNQ